jgi:FMNH2-dependent dimethyl sulfone monooxygenase
MVTVGSPEVAQAVAEALQPVPAGRRDAQYDHGEEMILAAEKAGFELCLFAERHLGHDLSAWVMASAIAAQFKTMCALVAVHPGLWDPALIARMTVSLDRISRGRVALNVVNGSHDDEFRMFGGTVLEGEERYKRTEEFITILRGLWSNETFSYAGDHYKIEAGQLLLKAASPAPPEIYSVSKGERGRDFIAQHCDWWFVDQPKDPENADDFLRRTETSIADMERRCKALGRKMRYGLTPFLALGDTQESALDEAVTRIFEFDPGADRRMVEKRMVPATRAGCVGPAAEVMKQLRRFEDIGAELVLCRLVSSTENMRRIGKEIITPLRQAQRMLALA